MANLRQYLFLAFNQIFFPLFFTLFFISSVILFVKIAGLTSIVQMTFFELFQLYFYSMPNVIFFTIPVSFFAACVIALTKLSYDYELPVLFSLGMNPMKIAHILGTLSLLVSLLLLIISLGMVPLSKQQYRQFIEEKQNNANINIRATEFGQKFGDWMLFINETGDDSHNYKDIVLFSNKQFEKESFLIAKDAQITGTPTGITLKLDQGRAFLESNNTIEQIDFEAMKIRDTASGSDEPFYGVVDYWKKAFEGDTKRAKDLCASILFSIFPSICILTALVFGIHNPRYHRNRSYVLIGIAIGVFYTMVYSSSVTVPLLGTFLVPIVWLGGSYWLYRRFVARYY